MENQKSETPRARARFTYKPEAVRQTFVGDSANFKGRVVGKVPLAVGAARMMKGRDGIRRQFTCREMSAEAERARREGRELTVGVVCFECGQVYATREDFEDDHQLTAAQYAENRETHTYAYWCEDKADPKSTETIAALSTEVKLYEDSLKDSIAKVSKCDDVEAMIKERKRAEELKGMIADARARKKSEDENIIGFLCAA
jgi:hypothetical protein